jgi:hypothetical protein
MNAQVGGQNDKGPDVPRKLTTGSRLAARLTGTSNDELAAAPDDEVKTVRLAGLSLILITLLSVLGWWVVHQVAAVHMSLPEQAELDELETLLDSPAKFRPLVVHRGLPAP